MAEATAKATPAAPEQERRVKVKLLHDVWINDPGHPDATPDGIRRVRTNTLILDEDGNPKINRKTRNFECIQEVVELPVSVVKGLLEAKKAERMDPL